MKKKYVKDYVSDGKGAYRYQGKYYQSRILEEERKKQGKIQILYGIVCLILILAALCIPCAGNKTVYIVIPLEATLVCLWGYSLAKSSFHWAKASRKALRLASLLPRSSL